MAVRDEPHTLELLLEKLPRAGAGQEEVSVRELRDAVGRRSFAPVLLLTSLIAFTPIGLVPGVPTILATVIILTAARMVMGYESIWLPRRILDRKVKRSNLKSATKKLQVAARTLDKIIRPRLTFLTHRPSSYVVAIVCVLLASALPPLELLPIVDIPLWGAIVIFSLALVAHDGLLAIAAFVVTAVGIGLLVHALI